jgi:prolyl-tRNA synthetase
VKGEGLVPSEKEFSQEITPQSVDFSRWYIDTIRKAELMDYSPVRGCIVFRPDGYEIWERIQQALDKRFKETGHRNAYFPLFIPESFLQKEKEHIEGFNPELPWVTEVGEEKLEERLAVRPTSETIIGHMYQRWIQSYRDLPVLLNQWANVVRWEKRTLPFLRTSEFLWQEGHTAHATEEEARAETMRMLDVYEEFARNELALPVIKGEKTPSERFAGAVDTYSIEAMMKDGRALQAGTSHYLGQNFARGFDIQFLDSDNELKYVHTTSWGVSTRLIGAVVMAHGDDRGLKLPPRLAPYQVVCIPVGPLKTRATVMERFDKLFGSLKEAGLRVKADTREEFSPGWKFNEYELRGVPLRVELGPRDVANNQVVVVRRDTGEKLTLSQDGLARSIESLLEDVQARMFSEASQFMRDNSHLAATLAELEEIISVSGGFVLAGWCGRDECEQVIKEKTKATARNIPFDPPKKMERCAVCADAAEHSVWYARSY